MHDDENPIEGKGKEMMPDKGLPFDNEGGFEEAADELQDEPMGDEVPAPETPSPADTLASLEEGEGEEASSAMSEPAAGDTPAAEAAPLLDEPVAASAESEFDESELLDPPEWSDDEPVAASAESEFDESELLDPPEWSDDEPVAVSAESEFDESELLDPPEASDDEPVAEEEDPDADHPEQRGIGYDDDTLDAADVDEDGGMGAGFFVPDSELEEIPDEPDAELSVPPKEAMVGTPMFSDVGYMPTDPLEHIKDADAPELSGDLQASNDMMDFFVTDERLEELWQRAERARSEMAEKIDELKIARQLLNQLRSAKTLIMAGKQNYEEADRAVGEVEYRLVHAKKYARMLKSTVWSIVTYEVVWMIALAIALIFVPAYLHHKVPAYIAPSAEIQVVGTDAGDGAVVEDTSEDLQYSFPSFITAEDIYNFAMGIIFGGLGGVIGAFFAIWRHTSSGDFSPAYKLWYYLSPLKGVIIGGFTFFFLQIVVVASTGSSGSFQSPYVVPALALIVGYRQNVFFRMVQQILDLFIQEESNDESAKDDEAEE